MPAQPRSAHHITSDEAELLFCWRLLKATTQAAIIALIASQIPTDMDGRQDSDTSVRLSLVSNKHT